MDIMIDLETLGTTSGCPIVSIGAVVFDRKTGQLSDWFYSSVGFEKAREWGQVSQSTVDWWNKQSEKARASTDAATCDNVKQMARDFYNWFQPLSKYAHVWGNGSSFDISILETFLIGQGITEPPWKFYLIRDCRTVEDLSTVSKKQFPRQGTHHNALDDAVYQAQYISAMIQQITS